MSFLLNNQPNSNSLSKSGNSQKPSFLSSVFPRKQTLNKVERISSCTLRGSLTLEAGILVPLFLFFCVTLTSLLEQYRTYTILTAAVQQVGTSLAVKDELALAGQIEGEIKAVMDSNGAKNLKVKNFNYLSGKYSYDLEYREEPLMNLWGVEAGERTVSYGGHLWIGYDVAWTDPRDEEIYVFVTPTGVVYHRSRNCTHLKLSVTGAAASELELLRNQEGERYRPCERCHAKPEGMVYLTGEGNRYHSDISCSSLRRSVRSMPLSQAQLLYGACSRCGGGY